MYSYRPLLDFLEENRCPRSILVEKGVLTKKTLAKIEKNESMNLETIDAISRFFGGLPMHRIVVLVDEKGNEFTNEAMPESLKKEYSERGFRRQKRYIIENFNEARKKAGYTLQDLADIMGVSYSKVRDWEQGKAISEAEFGKLGEILDINLDQVEHL